MSIFLDCFSEMKRQETKDKNRQDDPHLSNYFNNSKESCICFICGTRYAGKRGVCNICEKEFPTKKKEK